MSNEVSERAKEAARLIYDNASDIEEIARIIESALAQERDEVLRTIRSQDLGK